MASNKLEETAIEQRKTLLSKNPYNGEDPSNQYGAKHPNALSNGDDKGKGTGVIFDTNNGGSLTDIEGNPANPGSGRKKNLAFNKFNKDNQYKHPDTSGNEGQVVV